MELLQTAYAVVGTVTGLTALLIAGQTPPERRARVWTLSALVAVLWPTALVYVAMVVADELRAQRPTLSAPQEGA